MKNTMIGYAPFLGQVRLAAPLLGQGLPAETPSDISKRLLYAIEDVVAPYKTYKDSPWPYDSETMQRLTREVENCQTLATRVSSDPDTAAAEAKARECIAQLQSSIRDAYYANLAKTKSTQEAVASLGVIIPGLLVAGSIGASAYHGYKRNKSTGWGVWWGFMGLLFPVITPAVAIAQGYGKREK